MIGQFQPEGAEALAQILIRCRTVLGNMALENEVGLNSIFNRWPIGHEPLRADAKNLVPLIDEALSKHRQAGSGDVAVAAREPLAWRYELAHARFWPDDKTVGDYTDWRWHVSDTEPNAGDAMRNVTPLFAALPSEAIGREWKDISTAPKDGTVIFVTVHTDFYGWVRGTAHWESHNGISGWISRGVSEPPGELGLANPSHWMPLPAAPAVPRPNHQSPDEGK